MLTSGGRPRSRDGGTVEDSGVGKLDLGEGQVVEEPGLPVASRKRQRQAMNPALEEPVDGHGPEPVADLLQTKSILAGGEPIVQSDKNDPLRLRLAPAHSWPLQPTPMEQGTGVLTLTNVGPSCASYPEKE